MKIHQLPDGARFEYEGEEYVKTGPMFATGKRGRRLIPKYAVLKLLGAVADARPQSRGASVSRARVLEAFAAFHAECERCLPQEQRPALAEAREAFLKALD